MFNALGMPEGEELQHKMLSNAIETAQTKIENNNFGIRKNLLEYDQVMNDQREIIYNERRKVLDGENMRDTIISMIKAVVDKFVSLCISDEQPCSEWDINELNQILLPVVPLKKIELTDEELSKRIKKDDLLERLQKEAVELYEAKEKEFPEEEQIRELERVVLLKVIDRKWMDHIDDMDQLRQGIGLQAYGNKDPKVEYRISGFDMFDEMTASIQEDTVKMLLHIQVQQKVEREQVAKVTGTNKDDSLAKAPVKREDKKVYPNDPCPCGSGKKFKQCCQKKI
jgi:preprotein translocase subunit SecA